VHDIPNNKHGAHSTSPLAYRIFPLDLLPNFRNSSGEGASITAIQANNVIVQWTPSGNPFIHRPCSHRHPASNKVAHHCSTYQSNRSILAIVINDILVTANINCDQHNAENEASAKVRQDRYAWVVCLAQQK